MAKRFLKARKVEHSSPHPKGDGSNSAPAEGIRREKMKKRYLKAIEVAQW